jgi:hypothetical protein
MSTFPRKQPKRVAQRRVLGAEPLESRVLAAGNVMNLQAAMGVCCTQPPIPRTAEMPLVRSYDWVSGISRNHNETLIRRPTKAR